MSVQVDEATVHNFLRLIHFYAGKAINNGSRARADAADPHPPRRREHLGEPLRHWRVGPMATDAIASANAGHNVYIEGRTVRKELRGNKRGGLKDTMWVFGLVADCDADKGKAGNVTVNPTIMSETSPGNRHCWFVLAHAVAATRAKAVGDVMRAKFGADQDTGVVTQCYRVAGTPNFPSKAKRARGRTTIEPTKLIALAPPASCGRLDELLAAIEASKTRRRRGNATDPTARYYKAEELITALSAPAPDPQAGGSTPDADEATLPDDLLEIIRHGAAPGADRSEVFHKVIADLERRRWTTDAIVELLERYPNGIAEKYQGRVRQEVERSYGKVATGAAPAACAGPAPAAGSAAGRQAPRRTMSSRPSVSSPGSYPRSPQQLRRH